MLMMLILSSCLYDQSPKSHCTYKVYMLYKLYIRILLSFSYYNQIDRIKGLTLLQSMQKNTGCGKNKGFLRSALLFGLINTALEDIVEAKGDGDALRSPPPSIFRKHYPPSHVYLGDATLILFLLGDRGRKRLLVSKQRNMWFFF